MINSQNTSHINLLHSKLIDSSVSKLITVTNTAADRQNMYLACSLERNTRTTVISENELYFLGDKAELQSSSEDEKAQNSHTQLPFRSDSVVLSSRHRYQNTPKRKKTCFSWLQKQWTAFWKPDPIPQPLSRKLLIFPDGALKLSWDLLCMVLIFYEIITIPMSISFNADIPDELEQFVNICFYTDIIINFNTAIYIKGNIIYDRGRIALEYLKLWFWLDVSSSFPYSDVIDMILRDGQSGKQNSAQQIARSAQILRLLRFVRFVKIIRLLRLAKLKVIFDKIEEFLQLSTTIAAIMSFLQLSVFVLFWSHWLGCIFHFVAQNEETEGNWLNFYGIADTDWTIRYVNSIYWAVTTMTTVGYGDISPRTPIERLFGVFFLLVACGVFSFTMNTIGAALQQLEGRRQEYSKQMSNTNNYMKRVGIPTHLQNRVRRYLSYIWDSNHPVNLQHITENLSQSLKYEFTIQVNGSMLSKCQMICKMFADEILVEMTQNFKDATIYPDEFVFQELEEKYTDKSLYFIQEGQVKILQQRSKQTVAKLEKGDYFGELSFFSDMPRSASAQSVYFTDVYYIRREDFIAILKKHQTSLEKFASVRDHILFKKDMTELHMSCYSCLKDDHVVRDCPSLHFVVDMYMFNKIKSRSISMFMKQYWRKDILQFNSWKDKDSIQSFAKLIQRKGVADFLFNEECNLADNEEEGHLARDNYQVLVLESKFKIERKQRRIRNTQLREMESVKSIEMLQKTNKQILLDLSLVIQGDKVAYNKVMGLSRQVTINSRNNIRATLTRLTDQSPIKETSSSEEEKARNAKKLSGYIALHKQQRNFIETKINKDNPDVEKSQMFISIADFDRGANFTNYEVHNNLSQVLKEYDQCVLQEIHPCIDTVYSEHVYENLIDYYSLDLKDIKELALNFKEQTRDRKFTNMVSYKESRQEKRNNIYSSVSIINTSKSNQVRNAARSFQVPSYHYEPEQEEQFIRHQALL